MSLWHHLFSRRKRMMGDLDEDIRDFIERETQDSIDRGMSPEEARYAALRKFGNVMRVREETREVWSYLWLERLWQDVRYGLRQLRRSPGFAAVAVVTLALGIGANTAVFSVAYAVLLKPLPYRDPARLLRVYSANTRSGGDDWMSSAADIDFVRRKSADFQGTTYYQEGEAVLTGIGDPQQAVTGTVSEDFFSTLGVPLAEGRSFLPEEHTAGRDQVLVLSDALRRRLFGGRAAVGQMVTLDGEPRTVVGVMPPGFHFPRAEPPAQTEIWLPWSSPIDPANGNRDVAAIVRLKPGVKLGQAEAQLEAMHSAMAHEYASDADWRLRLVPLQQDVAGDARLPILAIFGAVSFVLLIACANVANLMLARGVVRQREMALRSALGARRVRLMRQLLTESALLSLLGGGVGLAIAVWGVHALRATGTTAIPRLAEVQLSGPVLLFTLASSLFVGILFGLVPALPGSSPALGSVLSEALAAVGGARRRSLNRFLLVAQAALSLVLLIGAGLMARSFLLLTSVNLGFQADNVLTFYAGLTGTNYNSPAKRTTFYQQTLERIGAVPGVEAVALASSRALTGVIQVPVRRADQPAPPPGGETNVAYQAVTSDYFRAMRIPLLQGRFILPSDGKDAPRVVVVNQAFAKKFFPGINPLGQRVYGGMGEGEKLREVVGVVGDVREAGLALAPSPEMYLPIFQAWVSPGMAYVVRTRVEPLSLAQTIRRAILEVDKNQPIDQIETMEQVFYAASAPPRFRTELLSMFSLLALVLTAVGLYGVTAYLVSQRTHEIGVRIALGATPARILTPVLRESAILIGMGILLGLGCGLGLARLVSSLLYGIKPTDPITIVCVSALMLAVGFLACYLPARRATKVDPMVALRYE
ncbi:MAG TPA: ABC transporter permease [Terriglobia bacterium]|nr:ABC transporter permease [Terriglobia bacterium]